MQAEDHHPNGEARGGSIMLWDASQNRCNRKEGTFCGFLKTISDSFIKATSENISQEVKAWLQMDTKYVGRSEKACASKEAYKPDTKVHTTSGCRNEAEIPTNCCEAC